MGDSAIRIEIEPDLAIRVANPAVLLATKLEAYLNRAKGDYVMSHDITDVVTLVEGRPQLVQEVARLGGDAKEFVRNVLGNLLSNPDFRLAIHGHLPPDASSQERVAIVLERLRGMLAQ